MSQLICDLDKEDEVFKAIQTILFAFSDLRRKVTAYKAIEFERDHLKETVTKLQSVLSSSNTSPNENRRKRTRTTTPPIDSSLVSLQDVTNDELNAAFHSSTCYDDDVIIATQIDTSRNGLQKSIKCAQSAKGTEQNKENDRDLSFKSNGLIFNADERSPTVLNRHAMKNESKQVTPDKFQSPQRRSGQKGSPSWKSKSSASKKGTPRRLFESWGRSPTSSKSPSSPQQKNQNKKKISLTLSSNTSRMKQSTINFPKQLDETYCDGLSTQMDEDSRSNPSTSMNTKIKMEKTEQMQTTIRRSSLKNEEQKNSSGSDSVIAITNDTDEVIVVNESEITQELYDHILDIKKELDCPTQLNESEELPTKNVNQQKQPGVGCADCELYHEMLGRDLGKNPTKKYGVCSKHYRNVVCPDTPPNFWNPKIIDTPEDERIATPFDSRFAKD